MSGAVSAVRSTPNVCEVRPARRPLSPPPGSGFPGQTADQVANAPHPRGHVPASTDFTTITGVVTEVKPDRFNARNGLFHQDFMIRGVSPAVRGQILEVDNDITPGLGTRAPVKVGQQVAVRGVIYRDDFDHDGKVDKMGIHWTHHAEAAGDAGCIAVKGRIYQ